MEMIAMSYGWSVAARVLIVLAITVAVCGLIGLLIDMTVYRGAFGKLVGWAGLVALIVAIAAVAVIGKDAEAAKAERDKCKCQATTQPKGE